MSESRRLFAIIPAAGLSRRMGQHKLLLDIGGQTVIERLLDVLSHPLVAERIVVMRASDRELATRVSHAGGTIVMPGSDPPDMKSSVEYGLRDLEHRIHPTENDGWLLVPADHPMLDPTVLAALVLDWLQKPGQITVPTYAGRRGHPTIFPWRFAKEVKHLPKDTGLNLLLQQNQQIVCEIPMQSSAVVTDLDTPEDYEALLRQFRGDSSQS